MNTVIDGMSRKTPEGAENTQELVLIVALYCTGTADLAVTDDTTSKSVLLHLRCLQERAPSWDTQRSSFTESSATCDGTRHNRRLSESRTCTEKVLPQQLFVTSHAGINNALAASVPNIAPDDGFVEMAHTPLNLLLILQCCCVSCGVTRAVGARRVHTRHRPMCLRMT